MHFSAAISTRLLSILSLTYDIQCLRIIPYSRHFTAPSTCCFLSYHHISLHFLLKIFSIPCAVVFHPYKACSLFFSTIYLHFGSKLLKDIQGLFHAQRRWPPSCTTDEFHLIAYFTCPTKPHTPIPYQHRNRQPSFLL